MSAITAMLLNNSIDNSHLLLFRIWTRRKLWASDDQDSLHGKYLKKKNVIKIQNNNKLLN